MKAYIAGPLFDDGERWWIERVDQVVREAGFTTFLPHRDNPMKTEQNVAEIFANERAALEHQWAEGADVSTEDLRVALRRYRSFFDRLLRV